MISVIRATAKIVVAASAAAAAFLPAAPSHAENFAFVSASGSGTACTPAQPCDSVTTALATLPASQASRVICLNGSAQNDSGIDLVEGNLFVDIDCPQGTMTALNVDAANVALRVRHFTFRSTVNGAPAQIFVGGSGTLILEDCTFADALGVALDIEPDGPLSFVIKNSRISNGSAGGILLKPAAGGSIKATLDHVTITGNTGHGIRTDSTNGVVNLDVADSNISNNGGVGINAIGGVKNVAGIKNSVISENGQSGVTVNGVHVGMLIGTTLLDQNAAGATSIVNSGAVLTYGNNQIIGSAGSGFTSTAPLQ